ncbi:MAG: hypothetical protein IJF72_04925 [Clostridia bacterium]|nr:hypothetical protein [Clostridia bacterium]
MKKIKIVLAVCLVLLLVTMAGCTPNVDDMLDPPETVTFTSYHHVKVFTKRYFDNIGGQVLWLDLTPEDVNVLGAELSFSYDSIENKKYVNPIFETSAWISETYLYGPPFNPGAFVGMPSSVRLVCKFYPKTKIKDNLKFSIEDTNNASKICYIYDGRTLVGEVRIIRPSEVSLDDVLDFIQQRLVIIDDTPLI